MASIKKTKDPVKLRQKKLKHGNTSLYLDIYYKGIRSYEFLNLYLTKANTPEEREKNQQTLQLALSIKAKRQIEIQNNQYGFHSNTLSKEILFLDYFKIVIERHRKKETTLDNYKSTLKQVEKYIKPGTTFENVNEKFVQGFKDYLDTKAKTKFGNPLSQNTKNAYFSKFRTVIAEAIGKDHILPENPAFGVPIFEKEESKREYLTFDEVKLLAKTECKNKMLKRMFLFSCMTGLRWSDVYSLTWGEIHDFNGKKRIIFRQEKTNGLEYLDLNEQAAALLGERGDKTPTETVFYGIRYTESTSYILENWCIQAGITNKHITFHSSRHTFAVMMLDLGVDIFTLSKLLGHKSIKSTQVYAKILDKP